MTESNTPVASPARPRATSYLWRLLWIVPGLILGGYGYWRYIDVPVGGVVNSIRLTTKQDLAGQTRDAYASINPGTSDFYLVLHQTDGTSRKTEVYKDTPLGNGLEWPLAPTMELGELSRVEVWDHNTLRPDSQLDRMELSKTGWGTSGQTYVVTLLGEKVLPPDWALPLATIAGLMAGLVVVKFVWDQAV